jgi:hypothetical protein
MCNEKTTSLGRMESAYQTIQMRWIFFLLKAYFGIASPRQLMQFLHHYAIWRQIVAIESFHFGLLAALRQFIEIEVATLNDAIFTAFRSFLIHRLSHSIFFLFYHFPLKL